MILPPCAVVVTTTNASMIITLLSTTLILLAVGFSLIVVTFKFLSQIRTTASQSYGSVWKSISSINCKLLVPLIIFNAELNN